MKKLVVLAVLVLFACDEPRPGQLLLVLETPNADDGAIAVRVTAEAGYVVDDIFASCRGCRAFTSVVSEEETRAVITGDIVNGLFMTLTVSDIRRPDRYTVSFESGASRTYDVRSSMAGYSVTVAR